MLWWALLFWVRMGCGLGGCPGSAELMIGAGPLFGEALVWVAVIMVVPVCGHGVDIVLRGEGGGYAAVVEPGHDDLVGQVGFKRPG